MDSKEGLSPRQPVLPPLTNRTLHHPSFLPLYMSAGFTHHHRSFNTQTVLPIIPPELFYTDPSLPCGFRIPNTVSEFRAFDCFQLNTPPPVMSACFAPPNRPDPFRFGTHPTRDLGSSTWRIHTIHPTTQPSRVVLQLTQEEDQAITNLLKLHHHEPLQTHEILTALHMDSSSSAEPLVDNMDTSSACCHSAEESDKHFNIDVQHLREAGLVSRFQQERHWSDTELEAADTLLSRFSLMEEDKLRVQTQQGSLLVQNGSNVFGDLSGVKERKLSDSEGDAVHVLLCLRDM